MGNPNLAIAAFADDAGGKSRVIAANSHQRGNAKFVEHGEKIFHVLLGLRRVRARRAENRAALEMDVPHITNRQRLDLRGVASGKMLETIAEADDLVALIDAFNRGRRDHAVKSGSRPAADQNS